jgi:hypothetical protein
MPLRGDENNQSHTAKNKSTIALGIIWNFFLRFAFNFQPPTFNILAIAPISSQHLFFASTTIMNKFSTTVCCILLWISFDICAWCGNAIPQMSSGYGADGPAAVATDSVNGRFFVHDAYFLFRPKDADRPLPVLFLIPGMGKGGDKPITYGRLLRHLASRGYCVVLLTYRMVSFPYQGMTYHRMFRGIQHAVRSWSSFIDTTRIGMVGHSFGASCIPSHLYRAITRQHWGSNGAFIYLMAPHYVFEITQEQLKHYPAGVKLVAEVFQDDDCNDHRMAKDIFETIGIPDSEKNYIVLLSDSNASSKCKLEADHSTPTTFDRGHDAADALDFYGVFRYIDALADYTFTGNLEGKALALGPGSDGQRFMGTWPDGTPVKQSIVSKTAPLVRPRSFYYFHWMHPWNVRRKTYHLWMPDSATLVP